MSVAELKHGTSEKFNHLDTAAKKSLLTGVIDVGDDSYVSGKGPTVASSVALNVVKSRFIEAGATISL